MFLPKHIRGDTKACEEHGIRILPDGDVRKYARKVGYSICRYDESTDVFDGEVARVLKVMSVHGLCTDMLGQIIASPPIPIGTSPGLRIEAPQLFRRVTIYDAPSTWFVQDRGKNGTLAVDVSTSPRDGFLASGFVTSGIGVESPREMTAYGVREASEHAARALQYLESLYR